MTSEKVSEIWKMLKEFNFGKSKLVPERLKCVKCRNILINACQISCGCQFCRECIEEIINTGKENCIGNSEDCEYGSLSKFFTDVKANKEIMRLALKCPEENCETECELIDMVNHLRLCPKKSVQCLFYDFGCDKNKIEGDKIKEHFFTEQENHNKIILEMIGALKNEMNEREERKKFEMEMLKNEMYEKEVKNKIVLETLKDDLAVKDEKMQSMYEDLQRKDKEIQSLKEETKLIREEAERQLLKFKNHFEKEMKEEFDDIIQSIDEVEKITPIEDPSEMYAKIDFVDEEIRECEERIDDKLVSLENTIRAEFNKNIKYFPIAKFEWPINNIRKHKKHTWINGTHFYGTIDPLEFILGFCNCGKYFDMDLGIYYNGVEDDISPTWPIHTKVAMRILNQGKLNIWKGVKTDFIFEKPDAIGFSYSNDTVRFFYKDYLGVLLSPRIDIIVQCFIYIK